MKTLFSFILHPVNTDTITALRSLITLRLAVISIVLLLLLQWTSSEHSATQWSFVIATTLLIVIWSILVLVFRPLHSGSLAKFRELAIDYGWVSVVLFFSGGSANPFIYYFLVLTAIASIILNTRSAWLVCGFGIIIYSILLLLDVQEHFEHFSEGYRTHLIGMWVNFVASATIICFFINHLVSNLRAQHERIRHYQEETLENEQLISLATVSASTIHNLATPLSTLTLLVDEFLSRFTTNKEIKSDLELMQAQIERCKRTMAELTSLAESHKKEITSIRKLYDAIKEQYAVSHQHQRLTLNYQIESESFISCTPMFQYAIMNLINNAVESSEQPCSATFTVENGNLNIDVVNQSAESLESIHARWGKAALSDKSNGLGIGSLLANSTINRQGGSVNLDASPIQGSQLNQIEVSIRFPLVYE